MKTRKSVLREYAESLLFSLVIVLFVRAFLVEAVQIPSGSMEETLLPGDHLFINKFSYRGSEPSQWLPFVTVSRKDVVIFKFVEAGRTVKYYVKRVVGLPGDTVQIRSKQVFINGVPLDEPYAVFKDPEHDDLRPRDHFGPLKVPLDHVFVLGDNRDRSYDSRFWGALPKDRIVGKPLFVWWSIDEGGPATTLPIDSPSELGTPFTRFFRQTRWARTGKVIY